MHKHRIVDAVKQTRPGSHQSEIELLAYPDDNKLFCWACILQQVNVPDHEDLPTQ